MFNNPYFSMYNPAMYATLPRKISLFSRIRSGINWGNLLDNTSKTLQLVNQAIPVFYQVKPLVQNARTMFRIANIIKDDGPLEKKTQRVVQKSEKNLSSSRPTTSNQPTFFL